MKVGNFIGCIILSIIFGFIGLALGDSFINYGSTLMCLVSIPYLVL